jgi:transposase InsO family protein
MATPTRGGLDAAVLRTNHRKQYASWAFAELCSDLGAAQSKRAVHSSAANAACETRYHYDPTTGWRTAFAV